MLLLKPTGTGAANEKEQNKPKMTRFIYVLKSNQIHHESLFKIPLKITV